MTEKIRQYCFLLKLLPVLPLFALFANPSRADIPAGWPWKITRLVYPTLGCPVIIKPDETFKLEFDFVGKGEGETQPEVSSWEVKLLSSNDRWPTEAECVVVETSTDGVSERWPGWSSSTDYWKGAGPWAGKEVWKVTVRVPAGTRTDLYDLEIKATGGSEVNDTQPHAVRVIDEYKDDFNFVQITDFHINDPRGPESVIGVPEPHPNSEEFIDYKYNLKAIDCVNLLNPDFVVMCGDTVFGIPFFVEYPWAATGVTDYTGTSPDWNGEYNKVYEQLLRLDVPIVCLPGNHDSYNLAATWWPLSPDIKGPLEGHTLQDGAEIWPTAFSPRYFGWDYGDKCHFTCIWSYDKEPTGRAFWDVSGLFPDLQLPVDMYGSGQVRGDQMAWIGQDLASAQGNYDLLVMATHHPFFGDYTSGDSFTHQTNRDELCALSRQTGVRLAVSGHTHVDNFFADTSGPEDIIHLNTTSTTFSTLEYPGFRRIFVNGGAPATYYYRFNSQTACYSYPVYADTILEKHDNPVAAFNALTNLHTPSIEYWFSNTAPDTAHQEFHCRNHLTEGVPPVSLDNVVADFNLPDLGDVVYYLVTNGTLLQYWRPAPGYLTLQVRTDTVAPDGHVKTEVDAPLPASSYAVLESGDYDGDGRSDIAVFRGTSGLWAVRGLGTVHFGADGDTPASGDYDGDGYTDISIFRPSTGMWAVKDVTRAYYGGSGDTPVPADYDGDGTCDIAVFDGAAGLWSIRGITGVSYGIAGDRPVPADYSGDGCANIAVFRPSTGLWAVRGYTRCYFGTTGDRPVPGVYEWYGSAIASSPFRSRVAVFREDSGFWAVRGVTRLYFGHDGDVPVPARFSGGSLDEIAVFRPSTGMWAVKEVTRAYFGALGDCPVTR